MNRPFAWVGVGVVLVGLGLVAFPVMVLGHELLDPEQVVGFLIAPLGLFVVMLAASSDDPRRTTVGGTFGNYEDAPERAAASAPAPRSRIRYPNDPVHCRHCRTVITADLARCPRCARARECRGCGRPLGQVLDRPTCPPCARAEVLCNCSSLPRSSGTFTRARARDVAG